MGSESRYAWQKSDAMLFIDRSLIAIDSWDVILVLALSSFLSTLAVNSSKQLIAAGGGDRVPDEKWHLLSTLITLPVLLHRHRQCTRFTKPGAGTGCVAPRPVAVDMDANLWARRCTWYSPTVVTLPAAIIALWPPVLPVARCTCVACCWRGGVAWRWRQGCLGALVVVAVPRDTYSS